MKELILGLLSCCCLPLTAQTFEDYFENKTLRVDYLLPVMPTSRKFFWTNCVQHPNGPAAGTIWTSCP